MSNYEGVSRIRAYAASALMVGTGMGAAGVVVGETMDFVHGRANDGGEGVAADYKFVPLDKRIELLEDQYNENEGILVAAYASSEQMTREYGEACIVKLGNYVTDGALADLDETEAVTNLINSDQAPCGKDSTDVQIKLRAWREPTEQIAELTPHQKAYTKYLKNLRKELKQDDDFSGWAMGGIIFGLLGVAFPRPIKWVGRQIGDL